MGRRPGRSRWGQPGQRTTKEVRTERELRAADAGVRSRPRVDGIFKGRLAQAWLGGRRRRLTAKDRPKVRRSWWIRRRWGRKKTWAPVGYSSDRRLGEWTGGRGMPFFFSAPTDAAEALAQVAQGYAGLGLAERLSQEVPQDDAEQREMENQRQGSVEEVGWPYPFDGTWREPPGRQGLPGDDKEEAAGRTQEGQGSSGVAEIAAQGAVGRVAEEQGSSGSAGSVRPTGEGSERTGRREAVGTDDDRALALLQPPIRLIMEAMQSTSRTARQWGGDAARLHLAAWAAQGDVITALGTMEVRERIQLVLMYALELGRGPVRAWARGMRSEHFTSLGAPTRGAQRMAEEDARS